ncbi:MAG: hypothetical protein IIU92_01115, partial [Bacteroidaceae bacterium]|nr:hypothetical protein [Bacteroidaceae bacterium]
MEEKRKAGCSEEQACTTPQEREKKNRERFNAVIGESLGFEGGYANSRFDMGGETNYGITGPFMKEYRHALPGRKTKPIKELTVSDALLLYKAMWDRYRLGEINDWRVAYVLNDYMINSYSGGVAKRTQKILNKRNAMLATDGIFGAKTIA